MPEENPNFTVTGGGSVQLGGDPGTFSVHPDPADTFSIHPDLGNIHVQYVQMPTLELSTGSTLGPNLTELIKNIIREVLAEKNG